MTFVISKKKKKKVVQNGMYDLGEFNYHQDNFFPEIDP